MIRKLSLTVAMFAVVAVWPFIATAAGKKDSVVIGMTLEPPGLDATTGAAAAISEITDYNIYEGLTKVNGDGSVTPLLAASWTISPDVKTYTFRLLAGVKFHDGEPFSSADVKFSFERAGAVDSTNKLKSFFQGVEKVEAPDPQTAVVTFKEPAPDALFQLGLSPAVIVDPKSEPTNSTKPVGTGPFKFDDWVKGSSVTMSKWDGYRDAGKIKLAKVTFRIINDPAAQVAALLAGDVDAIPRFGSVQSVEQFKNDPRFQVTVGGTEGKTIMSINNKRKPLDDVRVRRALAYAIDRKAIIDGAMDGYGTPIGSHYVPIDPGYIDLTGTYPYDPEKAKALLKEAGVATPLKLTLTLPPPAYARNGGEIIAAELAKVGVDVKIENVEWAQWLSGVYKDKNFDLTIISHVEPMDLMIYADPNYYFQYDSQAFRDIMQKANTTLDPEMRKKFLGEAQMQLATDAVNVFLFQLAQITVANAKLKGLWKDSPVFANDMSAVYWE
ncbi:MAG: ABC transporter substrate-binding protein [Hyphomicrobiales bacterium]|nr:ABC transporter substrate-binding protein [Hyphomicrobiales bacterium]MBV9975644.1 ABC transporter substrate-binding protein [Hyphomicrobiales bacterium]